MALSLNANAHSAHVHGKGEVKISVENKTLLMVFQTPQDGILGYERPPKSEAELAAAKVASSLLKDGAKLFSVNEQAGCVFKDAKLNAPNLQGTIAAPAKTADHVDVEVSYTFECAKLDQLKSVVINLFDQFKSIKVIQVQAAGAKKQKSMRLTASAREFKF